MKSQKRPWQKLTLKSAWFRWFGPFLESTVYLHWPKIWNTIRSTAVNMWFRTSSKTSAHRAARKHWRVFYSLVSWQCPRSQFATFFRNDWIRKSLKNARFTLMPRLGTKRLLPFWWSERKPLRYIVHDERRSNLCDTANFLWNSGNRTEKCVCKLDHETVLGDEEGWWIRHQIIQKESNYLYRAKKG
jgi:hypothetical protein